MKLTFDYSRDDLVFLMSRDTDGFVRWDAAQQLGVLMLNDMVAAIQAGTEVTVDSRLIDAYREILADDGLDKAMVALMLNLPIQAIGALVASLLIGTALLSLIGGIGAALTVGLKRGGMLISLLILPLYMPVLIFGSAAVQAAVSGFPVGPYLAILGAMLCLAIALAPLAMAAGLRIGIDA